MNPLRRDVAEAWLSVVEAWLSAKIALKVLVLINNMF